jgi:hypothetical protein
MGQSVAVGADGSIYVGGVTTSTNFPGQVSRPGTTPAFDGFVIKLNATGTQRVFSRLFGEDGLDGVYDVAVNAAGNMFVAGTGTLGSTTVNGCGRPGDKGLLGMLKTDGSGWEYLTPFGEVNSQILVDANDTAYVAGWGASGSIPQIGTVAQPTYGGGTSDAYLMKLDKLPNATATGCGPCTGDFGGAGHVRARRRLRSAWLRASASRRARATPTRTAVVRRVVVCATPRSAKTGAAARAATGARRARCAAPRRTPWARARTPLRTRAPTRRPTRPFPRSTRPFPRSTRPLLRSMRLPWISATTTVRSKVVA